MTNPNPVAPKTDTPATPRPAKGEPPSFEQFKRYIYDTAMGMSDWMAYERGGYKEQRFEWLESTLAAERASRLQAVEQAFNAGIEAAAEVAGECNPTGLEWELISRVKKAIRLRANPIKGKSMDQLQDKELQRRNGLTDAGRRWEDIHAEYAAMAQEKFYQEYPEVRPVQGEDGK